MALDFGLACGTHEGPCTEQIAQKIVTSLQILLQAWVTALISPVMLGALGRAR